MSLVNTIYNAVFRRSSTYALAIVTGAFFFERAFDMTAEHIYSEINKGKLWKDIKDKYAPKEDE